LETVEIVGLILDSVTEELEDKKLLLFRVGSRFAERGIVFFLNILFKRESLFTVERSRAVLIGMGLIR